VLALAVVGLALSGVTAQALTTVGLVVLERLIPLLVLL
jgi:hypothetical protein